MVEDEFCYLLRVRYAECDAQKVVFNARYGDYVDVAVGEYMRAIWGDYDDILARGIDNQVINYNITWKRPARFDDVLAITVKPKKIGNTSYTLQIDFYHNERAELIASAEIVYVMVSLGDHIKMPIPEDMRQSLQAGAKDKTIDHGRV